MTERADRTITIEAPARLHFGMLDLRGELGRLFGGIGAAVREPSLLLEVTPAPTLEVDGEDRARALSIARLVQTRLGSSRGARITIRRALPPHAGLGSGTQLALAVARALFALADRRADAASLATLTGRARRSAVGTWTFAHGGFVLEGGRHDDEDHPAPVLVRHPMPTDWRCVIAIPPHDAAVSGDAEARAFASLPRPPRADVERVAHLVLMAMLPALVEHDLEAFGAALSEIQQITGAWFAHAQGSPFAAGMTTRLVKELLACGAPGVGQSSWGPAMYALAGSEEQAAPLVRRARELLGDSGTVLVTTFDNEGARVRYGAPSSTTFKESE